MSDVVRFDPFDEHSGMEKSHDGLYVLASDYDRDTQALRETIRRLTNNSNARCPNHRMHGLEPYCAVCLITQRDALQRRVEELDKRAGCWHGETGHACQLDDVVRLTTQLAAAREALKAITQGGT